MDRRTRMVRQLESLVATETKDETMPEGDLQASKVRMREEVDLDAPLSLRPPQSDEMVAGTVPEAPVDDLDAPLSLRPPSIPVDQLLKAPIEEGEDIDLEAIEDGLIAAKIMSS